MSYCLSSDALALIPKRAINSDTKPSTTDVEGYVLNADNIIDLKLKQNGIDAGEITDDAYQNGLKQIAMRLVCGMLEGALKADSGAEEGEIYNNAFYKEGRDMLNEFVKDYKLNPPTANVETVIKGITTRDDELEPHFHMNERIS